MMILVKEVKVEEVEKEEALQQEEVLQQEEAIQKVKVIQKVKEKVKVEKEKIKKVKNLLNQILIKQKVLSHNLSQLYNLYNLLNLLNLLNLHNLLNLQQFQQQLLAHNQLQLQQHEINSLIFISQFLIIILYKIKIYFILKE